MRSRLDENGKTRGTKKRKSGKPKGGKALQRLLTYLAERDPPLIADVVDPVVLARAARPKVGPAQQGLRAKKGRSARGRARGTPAAARAFATAIAKAARKVAASQPRARRAKRATRARAVVAAPGSTNWTSIGPSNIPNGQTYGTSRVDVIGRVSSIAIDPGDSKHLLCGSANGGIWESKDAGATWAVRTDQMPSLAIGAVTFDPHDPKRVYAGSGEGNFYANLGAGVYRSTDGGTTWTVLATAPFVGIGFYDLVVDPVDKKILYAATTNGFYVSVNSGASWSRKRSTKCWDITVHPAGGTVELLAAFADGLFASTNAGSTFAAVALSSAPAAAWDRLAVDRVAAAPEIAYVFGAAAEPRISGVDSAPPGARSRPFRR